jgi:DGQHR domain-containing protein
VLRVLDGQHRLLALHGLSQTGDSHGIEVPAVLFDSLDARQVVELFVTINAKHTRLNPSHIISLAGRKLYPDPNQALAHDVIRSLNEDETSPLHGDIKMLGTGRGRVSQAPLAEEMVDFFETVEQVGGRGRIQELRGEALRPELRQGDRRHLPHRLGRPQVLDQDRGGPARLHPRRSRRHGAGSRAAP